MKIQFYLILFCSSFIYSQQTIELKEIAIPSKIDYFKLIKKISQSVINSSDTLMTDYKINFKTKVENDSVALLNDKFKIRLLDFNGNFKLRAYPSLKNKLENINRNKFTNCSDEYPPVYWVLTFPINRSLRFFKNEFFKKNNVYRYKLTDKDDEYENLEFDSDSLYAGVLTYNKKTKRPVKLEFKSVKPYSFGYSATQNARTQNNVESSWDYTSEHYMIELTEDEKTRIKRISIQETINNFKFKQYTKRGEVIFKTENNFSTEIELTPN